MTRLLIALLIASLSLAGCGANSAADPTAIAQAVQATVVAFPQPDPVQVEVTRIVEVPVEVTRVVEATRIVEVEITATPLPAPSAEESPASLVKYPDAQASQNEGGLILGVTGVSIVPLADMPEDFQDAVSGFDYWTDIVTVIALSVAVTNTTDSTLVVHPGQGAIVAGNQQADADLWTSDDVGGDIFAGVTKTGLVLFGLPQPVDPASLADLRYIVGAATNQDYSRIGSDFDLTVPLLQP